AASVLRCSPLSRALVSKVGTKIMDFDKFNDIKFVYRFFGKERHNLTGLKEEYLWCSRVEAFNDPFENVITENDFDFRKFSVEEISIFLESNPQIRYRDAKSKKGADVSCLDLGKLLNSQKESVCNDLNKATVSSVNTVQTSKFHCLSHDACDPKPLDNRLLWSHYASGLRGFVIEFELDSLLNSMRSKNGESFFGCHLIDYLSTDFETFIKSTIKERSKLMLNDFLFTKHVDWEYENELRLISSINKLNYSKSCINRIIVGEKMSLGNKVRLYKIAKSKGLADRLFTASIRRSDFSIQLTPCKLKN
ncbi:DUF2971 domain-containing protein, partial [Vibrio parahaemolyticus]|uniref:DUF2971 domain-containing protein n=1 Tax=Vibrio parahaemolyticus TaxID=670 RepID=UPI001E4F9D9B